MTSPHPSWDTLRPDSLVFRLEAPTSNIMLVFCDALFAFFWRSCFLVEHLSISSEVINYMYVYPFFQQVASRKALRCNFQEIKRKLCLFFPYKDLKKKPFISYKNNFLFRKNYLCGYISLLTSFAIGNFFKYYLYQSDIRFIPIASLAFI